jgi:DNA anti-recombination protein RmuC
MENVTAIASVISALVLIVVLIKLFTLGKPTEAAPAPVVDAQELAGALGSSIESAFRDFVPQPDKMSAALSGVVTQAAVKANEGVASAGKAMDDAAAKLSNALGTHAQQVEKIETASREQLKTLLTQHADSLQKSNTSGADQLKLLLATHADSIQKSTTAGHDQLKALLTSHADSLQKATATLAAQLDKVAQLEQDIKQILHIQQVTDGSIKQLAASAEFTQTLGALRQHLATSDGLIKEVTKPRTIRLVESET